MVGSYVEIGLLGHEHHGHLISVVHLQNNRMKSLLDLAGGQQRKGS